MIRFTENEELSGRHTFGLKVQSKYFLETDTLSELFHFLSTEAGKTDNFLIIGEGSNLLFTQDFPGLIFHPIHKAISIIEENDEDIIIQSGTAHNWDNLVDYCVSKGYGGLENLSNIPGSVGAAPVQNIGAYGAEAQDVITEVHIADLEKKSDYWINARDCHFGYRDSIFKKPENQNLLVWDVRFRLKKRPQLNTSYAGIQEALKNHPNPTILDVRESVIKIRSQKLPDPKTIGNAGSFFKNPVLNFSKAQELKSFYPDIPIYPTNEKELFKVSAAWLIDQAGLKGIKRGQAGTHKNQALVLVNLGDATGKQMIQLAREIQDKVFEKYDISLEPEVRII